MTAMEQKFDQKINDLEQKFDQKINDLEEKFNEKIGGLEQKVDAGFAQVNQRLDKIENCPTIKKELAEQNEQINNLDANEPKSNETNKASTNDKKDEENN